MNIKEIKTPITAALLNENLAKRFGMNINLEKFTLEQLEDARNKLRTRLRDIETNESYDAVKSEAYQKSKLFLDVLNQAIKEADKPDFLDLDKDGDKKEPMKKAAKDKGGDKDKKKDLSKVPPQLRKHMKEGEEDKAELVMAAKDMVNRVTGWMEDTAEMQSESMLELADAIRDEMGSEVSEQFTATVKPALEGMYTAMESARESLTQALGTVTGEADPVEPMGDEEPAMEPTVDADADAEADAEMEPAGDEFAASEPAAGDEEEGRPTRESIERSRKLGAILSKKK